MLSPDLAAPKTNALGAQLDTFYGLGTHNRRCWSRIQYHNQCSQRIEHSQHDLSGNGPIFDI